MKHIKYFLQFLFIGCLLIFFKIVGLKFSRVIASNLLSTIGHFFRSKKIIEKRRKDQWLKDTMSIQKDYGN